MDPRYAGLDPGKAGMDPTKAGLNRGTSKMEPWTTGLAPVMAGLEPRKAEMVGDVGMESDGGEVTGWDKEAHFKAKDARMEGEHYREGENMGA